MLRFEGDLNELINSGICGVIYSDPSIDHKFES